MRIPVRDLMVPAAKTTGDATIAAARSLMLRQGTDEVYIVDEAGMLRGIVADFEFLKAELSGIDGAAPLSSLASPKVESVEADEDVAGVFPRFREINCGRIAVVESGRLIGRLKRSEVLRLVLHLRDAVEMTEVTAGPRLAGPHFHRRKRPTPVRRLPKSGGRKRRRIATS